MFLCSRMHESMNMAPKDLALRLELSRKCIAGHAAGTRP